MMIPASSSEYIFVPVRGPVTDLTIYTGSIAIMPEGSNEPVNGDYQAAAWIGGQLAYKPTANQYTAGNYMVWVRLIAGSEDVRMISGRLRVGDSRS